MGQRCSWAGRVGAWACPSGRWRCSPHRCPPPSHPAPRRNICVDGSIYQCTNGGVCRADACAQPVGGGSDGACFLPDGACLDEHHFCLAGVSHACPASSAGCGTGDPSSPCKAGLEGTTKSCNLPDYRCVVRPAPVGCCRCCRCCQQERAIAAGSGAQPGTEPQASPATPPPLAACRTGTTFARWAPVLTATTGRNGRASMAAPAAAWRQPAGPSRRPVEVGGQQGARACRERQGTGVTHCSPDVSRRQAHIVMHCAEGTICSDKHPPGQSPCVNPPTVGGALPPHTDLPACRAPDWACLGNRQGAGRAGAGQGQRRR